MSILNIGTHPLIAITNLTPIFDVDVSCYVEIFVPTLY